MPDIRIETVRLAAYRLPLRSPWASARGRLHWRQGWLVEIGSAGLSGYGDCAPLTEAGTESAEAAEQALRKALARLNGCSLADASAALADLARKTPAASFALECALLDLEARLRNLPLRRLLTADAADRVPVNAVLGTVLQASDAALRAATESGFRVLKLKVGTSDFAEELDRLSALAEALPPDASLRLDANGAWDFPTASRAIEAIAGLPIDCLEEPLSDPSFEWLAELQAFAPFPLALDESLPRWLAAGQDPSHLPVRRAVLKPAALGGLTRTFELSGRLREAGKEVAVTSMLESAAGLWPVAQVAAAIGGAIPHGLATADWLAEDLGSAPRPSGAMLHLPDCAGSGFSPVGSGAERQ
jgi:o-succinylbenzoate synthase